jgi:DNA-3-methyladenine glycosylase II
LIDGPPVDPFSALVRTIVGQQLSVKAAATIHGRLLALMPGGVATPHAIAALEDAQLRAVGMSRQKSAYLRDLAAKSASGELRLEALSEMADEQVIEAIMKVKGLGRWSAEMFLMFRLRRPDVLPVDDLGIVNAIHRLYGLRKKPTADRIRKIGEAWRPYRTVACYYLWRSLENTPQ